jgi:outer membrane receptor for ferrienterochelin and colicins
MLVGKTNTKLDQRGSDELDAKELTNDRSSQGTIQLDHELTEKTYVNNGNRILCE